MNLIDIKVVKTVICLKFRVCTYWNPIQQTI
jgi:hypothetical protein